MRRCVFMLASACSLLLFLGTLFAWFINGQIVVGEAPAKDGDYYVLLTDFPGFLFTRIRGVPYALLALMTLVLPTAWEVSRHLQIREAIRRRLQHRCPTCSYNLTANTSGVCPECGTPIASP